MFRYLDNITAPKNIVLVLVLLGLSSTHAEDYSKVNSNSPTVSAATNSQHTSSLVSSSSAQQSHGYDKRNIKATDLKASSSAAAKSYDPPPEFYRGPGSTSKTSSSSTVGHNRDSATASFVSKPISFPDLLNQKNSNDLSQKLANSFNSWQILRGQGAQDRISVKPYGSGEAHGLTSGYAPGGGGGHYSYQDVRPYSNGGHYIDYGAAHAGGGGHYGASGHGGYYGGAHSAEAGAIPFDVYGGGKGSGHYAGAGGEYSYSYPELPHEAATHKGPHDLAQKALLAKSFLIPLASAAVLGIAAALVSNPLLLQLGTVSGLPVGTAVAGKRRRRDLMSSHAALTASGRRMKVAAAGAGADIAYRAQHLSRKARV
uniref:Uncharacterized protein n=1 Tax=Ceratitis capitata TaxID=7213 RepID=W8BYI6_CERCA